MIVPKKKPNSAGLGIAEMCCNLCRENDHTLKNTMTAAVTSVASSVVRRLKDRTIRTIPNDGEMSNRNHGIHGLGGRLRGQRLACQ